VIHRFPDQDGRTSMPPNLVGREKAMRVLWAAGGRRVAVYGIENEDGTPIYVHSKVCVIDDTWACVGSDNANRRSWTHDSELSSALTDMSPDRSESWARSLRHDLSREHLGADVDHAVLNDSARWFDAFQTAASDLDDWHRNGRRGPRPPGQLRRWTQPALSPWTRVWATPLYRLLYDPDGRSVGKRWARRV
jgi:phosphatidylserine/phosphatidylglycerophosphate/cardiolipin synthase-like enzyme